MFEALYSSPWHHPYSFWIGQLAFLLVLLVRPPAEARWRLLLAGGLCLAALDAYLTADSGPLRGAALTVASTLFVVLGDWRYWFVVIQGPVVRWPRAALVSLFCSLLVPLFVFALRLLHVLPAGRWTFLVYEIASALFAIWLLWMLGKSQRPNSRLIRTVATFWLCMYGAWASADVLILAGVDGGYALRLVANELYYVGFWPIVYLALRRRESAT